MESVNLTKEELINLIYYGLSENNIDIKSVSYSKIEIIIEEYTMLCNQLQNSYVIGEFDTFKRAACLLVAINKWKISDDKRLNASVGIDAAYKMCEKPYWNVGENYDTPKKLEEVNFKRVFQNNMEVYNKSKNMLIDSLVYGQSSPLSYYFGLKMFYQLAILLKHNPINVKNDEISKDQSTNFEESMFCKKKSKIFSLFSVKR